MPTAASTSASAAKAAMSAIVKRCSCVAAPSTSAIVRTFVSGMSASIACTIFPTGSVSARGSPAVRTTSVIARRGAPNVFPHCACGTKYFRLTGVVSD